MLRKGRWCPKLTPHQRVADKQFARYRRVDRCVVHLTALYQRQSIQSNPLKSHHLRTSLLPMGFGITAPDQVLCQWFNPCRIDVGGSAQVTPAGFHQLAGNQPFRFVPDQPGTGKQGEFQVAGAGVFTGVHLESEVTQ